MKRIVVRELLDELPFDDPEAQRSRREIQRLNTLMGNHRRIERKLLPHLKPGDRILELGSGGGELAARLRKAVPAVDGLDLCPPPDDWPKTAHWRQEDACQFDGYGSYDVVVANLLLHQFSDEDLAQLGERLDSGPRIIIACEPARRRRHLLQFKLISRFGFGRVTRHDAVASIRAGFRDDELPRLLGLAAPHWECECRVGFRGQYLMLAQRNNVKENSVLGTRAARPQLSRSSIAAGEPPAFPEVRIDQPNP